MRKLAFILLLLAGRADAACTWFFHNGPSLNSYWICDLAADVPVGPVDGDMRYNKDTDSTACYNGATWAGCGIAYYAPIGAQYWVGAADATLTAEKNLGALATGLVINTAGTPSAYTGTSCTNQFPRSLNASGAATCASVASADLNITATTCTNQFLTGISSGGAGTCTTDTLASAQHANQGTTSTVLHGNAAGNPSWGQVSLATDVASATSANLRSVLSDETGTGAAMFGISTSMSDDASCSAYQTVRRNSGDTAWECVTAQYPTTVKRVSGSNVTSTSTSFADITGLTHTVAASTTYSFRCNLLYATAASTTALQVALNGPSTPTYWVMGLRYGLTSSTYFSDFQQNTDGYNTATNPGSGSTSGETVDVWGTFINGSNAGTLALRLASEVAASTVTIYIGSWCVFY